MTLSSPLQQQRLEEDPFEGSDYRRRLLPFARYGEAPRLLASAQRTQPFSGAPSPESYVPFHSQPYALRGAVGLSSGFSEDLRSPYSVQFFAAEGLAFSAKLRRRMAELFLLQPGWDGQTALPPKPEVLARIVGLLVRLREVVPDFQEPFLAPTLDGFAQVEWETPRRALELEATDAGWSILGNAITSHGERTYYEAEVGRSDTEKLLDVYGWLHGRELLWPIS